MLGRYGGWKGGALTMFWQRGMSSSERETKDKGEKGSRVRQSSRRGLPSMLGGGAGLSPGTGAYWKR